MPTKILLLFLTSSALILAGCGRSEYSSDASGKMVKSVNDAGIRQVCVDGVLYLSSANDIVIQRGFDEKPVTCSVKSDKVLEHARREFEGEQITKLKKTIESRVEQNLNQKLEKTVEKKVEQEVGELVEQKVGEIVEKKVDLMDKSNSD